MPDRGAVSIRHMQGGEKRGRVSFWMSFRIKTRRSGRIREAAAEPTDRAGERARSMAAGCSATVGAWRLSPRPRWTRSTSDSTPASIASPRGTSRPSPSREAGPEQPEFNAKAQRERGKVEGSDDTRGGALHERTEPSLPQSLCAFASLRLCVKFWPPVSGFRSGAQRASWFQRAAALPLLDLEERGDGVIHPLDLPAHIALQLSLEFEPPAARDG